MSSILAHRFEHRLEHYSDGDLDNWRVLATKRGDRDPMAKCYSRDDAALIVTALDAAMDKAA